MHSSRKISIANLLLRLEIATDIPALQTLIETSRDTLGVTHVLFHCVSGPKSGEVVATVPDAWTELYYSSGQYLRDPVYLRAARSFEAFDWKDLDWSGKDVFKFLMTSMNLGFAHQGYSFPIHGPHGELAVFSINHDCDDEYWHDFVHRNQNALFLLGHCFHRRARSIWIQPFSEPIELSERETSVITLIARGNSRAEAAEMLSISEHTLRDHLDSARRKLKSRTTTEAVARAISGGQIVA